MAFNLTHHVHANNLHDIIHTELIETEHDKHIGHIVAELEGSAGEIYNIITDFKNFASFMPNMKNASILKTTESFVELEVEVSMPFPLSNITYVNHIKFFPEQYRTKFHMVPGSSKNAEKIHGHWILTPHKKNRTLAEYQVFFLTTQRYPRMIEEKATRRSLKKLIEAVQSEVLIRRKNTLKH